MSTLKYRSRRSQKSQSSIVQGQFCLLSCYYMPIYDCSIHDAMRSWVIHYSKEQCLRASQSWLLAKHHKWFYWCMTYHGLECFTLTQWDINGLLLLFNVGHNGGGQYVSPNLSFLGHSTSLIDVCVILSSYNTKMASWHSLAYFMSWILFTHIIILFRIMM